jgi:CRISPR-associated protein Csm1
MLFQQYQSQILAALDDKPLNPFNTEGAWQWIIKGDVSGIQDFIFSVKSDKASKALKGRSRYIERLADRTMSEFSSKYGQNFKEIISGGGNFYCLIRGGTKEEFLEIDKLINESIVEKDVYVAITALPITTSDLIDFEKAWFTLQKASVDSKFGKYAFTLSDEESFNKIFGRLNKDEEEYPIDKQDKLPVWHNPLINSNLDIIERLKLEDELNKVDDRIKPIKDNIVELRYLSAFAKKRTGTEKLAVLKMDVDDLGREFIKRKSLGSLENLSESLSWFFETHLIDLLKEPIDKQNTEGDKFKDNIYVVFAGGDDCFMVGAWDTVFMFAKVIRESFEEFTKKNLNLSASLTLIDEKYPVIRFARLAEEALKNAKNLKKQGETEAPKNRISVFNQVLEWDEYYAAQDIAKQLEDLIKNKGESRAILDRIKNSRRGFEKMQNNIHEGFLKAQELWRLQWFLRSAKNKEAMQKLLDKYDALLLKAATSPKRTNPIIFPVAARWAEFATKNKSDYVKIESETE